MSTANGYVLGIDLGTNSLGAALIDTECRRIVWSGVRIFTPGFEGDYESGREESRAAQRRLARQQRRQTDRRRRRRLNVFRILQQYRLLPPGTRDEIVPALDFELQRKYQQSGTLPYFLRARALDEKLEPFELGRALYHLSQRRGFRGRTSREADQEEGGKIRKGIEGLWREIESSGSRTLGEYLSKIDTREQRIRDRRTHRRMFEQEFALIWESQKRFRGDLLSDQCREALFRALFYQRPLKPADDLIGYCDLEPEERRAPLWMPEVQHYRVLTAINNLRLVERSGTIRPLDERERRILIDESLKRAKISFAQVRKFLGLPANSRFSIEEGGETNLPGNATSHRLFSVLGNDWLEMNADRQRDLATDLADPKRHETDEDVCTCMSKDWCFPPDTARALAAISLPDKYSTLSLKAIRAVTPLLERGISFAEAKRILWPEHFVEKDPKAMLPPVNEVLPEVRNPGVIRSLSELRKMVNAVIRRYGKPASIHIELARDIKRGREERQKESRRNRERERLRDEAKRELNPLLGPNVARRDIEKYLLWRECGKRCPYTGSSITLQSLFGEHPRFDIEHIIPFDRSLDDSFQNKTLCEAQANRQKGKRTPWEAFGHSPEWEQMVERVRDFGNAAKLRRFTMSETDADKLLEDFTSRQLNDTKYASRLAARYLGQLYGIDRSDNRRIITCAGQVTAFLRQKWDLNRVLNTVPEKSRNDHRHHAVDAIAIAMAGPAQIKALADAARRAQVEGHRRFGSFADPWKGFREQACQSVHSVLVSHRPKRRLKGALHEETHYSAPEKRDGKTVVRCRKSVASLTAGDISNIVDPRIRNIVTAAWEAAGRDSKKLQDAWPALETRGMRIPIKCVRCFKSESVELIASRDPKRARHVVPAGNHHMEVLGQRDPQTKHMVKWSHRTVSVLEAAERYRRGDRIVQRGADQGWEFCFSLSEGDSVRASKCVGEPEKIWYVRTVRARGSFELSAAVDARRKQDIQKNKELWDVQLNTLMRLGGCKVVVTPLGEVIEAHD